MRGQLYEARFEPVEGSEQGGIRPAVIVSRESINQSRRVVIAVSLTTYRPGKALLPSQVLVRATDANGLDVDSVALCEQVRAVSKTRLLRFRGTLSASAMSDIDRALKLAMDLR